MPQKAADVSQADLQSPSLGSSLARVQNKNADKSMEKAQLLVSSGHGDLVAAFAQSFRHHLMDWQGFLAQMLKGRFVPPQLCPCRSC